MIGSQESTEQVKCESQGRNDSLKEVKTTHPEEKIMWKSIRFVSF